RNPQHQCIMKRGVQDRADVAHLVRCGCLAVSVGVQSILPPNRRMNRSLSHFACAGEGALRYSSCSAMLSMKWKSRPWKRCFLAAQCCAISCHEYPFTPESTPLLNLPIDGLATITLLRPCSLPSTKPF